MSFAGTGYRVGNRYAGQVVGVRVVADTVQITQDGFLLRTHRARHDSGLTAAGYAVGARYSRASPEPKMSPSMNSNGENRWLLSLLGQRSSMFPWSWSSSPSSAKRV